MKNLVPYDESCFEVHLNAIFRKSDNELKQRLNNINPLLKKDYDTFLINFNKNTLNLQEANSDIRESIDDLKKLYNYKSKTIREVREKIKKLQLKTITTTCQNCTINTVNTMDHILPQSVYPEFIVNPKNLFPCCSECNNRKLNFVDNGSNKRFLNLYLDELPKSQYLYVKIFKDKNNELDFEYYLHNDGTIDENFFSVLEYHYSKLKLFERFKFKAIEYLSEFEIKIRAFLREMTLEQIFSILVDSIEDEKEAFGCNHWKCILELALIDSNVFRKSLK